MELEALESLISNYSALLNMREVLQTVEPELNLQVSGSSRTAKKVYISRLLEEIRRVLIAEGRPLKRSDLVARLLEQGFEIEGRDKSKVLGTNIWRSGRFKHIDGHGYWPSDVPLPTI